MTTSSPAAERNKIPILAVLAGVLPGRADVLEIASGTGQHAAHFAASRADWTWQPSDADPEAIAAIAARTAALTNVQPAIVLDVLAAHWPPALGRFDAVYCANLIHIAAWPSCAALMSGAADRLRAGGALVLYGPYFVDGEAAAPSNVAFDVDLRRRNPAWGIRRLADVIDAAEGVGLAFERRADMPANNLMLVFRR